MTRSTLLLCLILAATPAAAQIYQWRDASGKLNYSDRPPPGVDARVMKGGAKAPTAAPAPVTTPSPEPAADAAKEPVGAADVGNASADGSQGASTVDESNPEGGGGSESAQETAVSDEAGDTSSEAKAPAEPAPATTTRTPATAPAVREKTTAEKELEFRQRRAAIAEQRAKAEAEARQKEERDRVCRDMRNNLAALESGQRVSRFNASGERVFIDDATRSSEIQRYRGELQSKCAT